MIHNHNGDIGNHFGVISNIFGELVSTLWVNLIYFIEGVWEAYMKADKFNDK